MKTILPLFFAFPFLAIAASPALIPFDSVEDLTKIGQPKDPELVQKGNLEFKTSGARTYALATLNEPDDGMLHQTSWAQQISLRGHGGETGPVFEVAFDTKADETGLGNIPLTFWGITTTDDPKPTAALPAVQFVFIDTGVVEVQALGKNHADVEAGADGFVSLRFVFDLQENVFDLYANGKKVIDGALFKDHSKISTFYAMIWGGRACKPGTFTIDNFRTSYLSNRNSVAEP